MTDTSHFFGSKKTCDKIPQNFTPNLTCDLYEEALLFCRSTRLIKPRWQNSVPLEPPGNASIQSLPTINTSSKQNENKMWGIVRPVYGNEPPPPKKRGKIGLSQDGSFILGANWGERWRVRTNFVCLGREIVMKAYYPWGYNFPSSRGGGTQPLQDSEIMQ